VPGKVKKQLRVPLLRSAVVGMTLGDAGTA